MYMYIYTLYKYIYIIYVCVCVLLNMFMLSYLLNVYIFRRHMGGLSVIMCE